MENLLGKLGWPGASVILGLLGTILLLAWPVHVPLEKIAWFVGALAVAYGSWVTAASRKSQDDIKAQQQEIKVQVNGNNDALRQQVQQAYAVMAQMADQNGRLLAQVMAKVPPDTTLPAAIANLAHPSPLDALVLGPAPVSGAGVGATPTSPQPVDPAR